MDEVTVRALHAERSRGREAGAQLDDGTWEDSDLPQVFESLDSTASPLGKLVLYDWLRSPAATAEALVVAQARLALAQRLEASPGATASVSRVLTTLPRLPRLLVETVWGVGMLPSLGALPTLLTGLAVLAPLGFFLSMNLGLGLVAGAFVINMAAHFWWNRRVFAATASVDFLAAALRCARTLADEPSLGAEAARLEGLAGELRALGRAARELSTPVAADDIGEYFQLYFLTRERRLTACAALVSTHRSQLQALFDLLGELDAAVAAGRFRRAQPGWCVPQLEPGTSLVLEEVRHPLLGAGAVPSTLDLDRRMRFEAGLPAPGGAVLRRFSLLHDSNHSFRRVRTFERIDGSGVSGRHREARRAEEALGEGRVIHESGKDHGAHHRGRDAQGFVARLVVCDLRAKLRVDETQQACRDVRKRASYWPPLARCTRTERRYHASSLGVLDVGLREVDAKRVGERDVVSKNAPRGLQASGLDSGCDELVPVLEMCIEAAVGQAGGLHQRRDAHARQAVLSERLCGSGYDALANSLLVAFGVSHDDHHIIHADRYNLATRTAPSSTSHAASRRRAR